ncbi:MAG: CDP-alcohol phosphatidyltransferase family protein [Deltaproteobacteria bacterium]
MSAPEEVIDRSKGKKGPQSSKMLGGGFKNWWLLMIRPFEDYLIEQKVHPNVLTVTTLVVSVVTGLFFHVGWIFVGGVLLLAGSTFDIFDGRVARAQGLSTEHGAFFDSCLDRFSEAFIYLGLLGYFHGGFYAYVMFLILAMTMMVSYTRARAEGLGVDCEVGVMQRTERVVYLGVLAVFNYFGNYVASAAGFTPGDYLLKAALLILLVFSTYTAVYRMIHVMGRLKERERAKRDTLRDFVAH